MICYFSPLLRALNSLVIKLLSTVFVIQPQNDSVVWICNTLFVFERFLVETHKINITYQQQICKAWCLQGGAPTCARWQELSAALAVSGTSWPPTVTPCTLSSPGREPPSPQRSWGSHVTWAAVEHALAAETTWYKLCHRVLCRVYNHIWKCIFNRGISSL